MADVTFAQFLKEQIEERLMTPRQFALWIEVHPTTVTRMLDPHSDITPSMDFLGKMSEKTNISLQTLLAIVYPEWAAQLNTSLLNGVTAADPSNQAMLEAIQNLPPAHRDVVWGIIARVDREKAMQE